MADETARPHFGEHCWHYTGTGRSHESGGTQDVKCCHCNARGQRPWTIRMVPVPGHGPHFTTEEAQYGAVIVAEPVVFWLPGGSTAVISIDVDPAAAHAQG